MCKCVIGRGTRVSHHAIMAFGLAAGLFAATADAAGINAPHPGLGDSQPSGCGDDATLSFNADKPCYHTGDTVCITIDVSQLPRDIVGGQYHFFYDTSTLQFVDIRPGDHDTNPDGGNCAVDDPQSPFAFEVFEDAETGHISYASSVREGSGDSSPDDNVMATIEFVAVAEGKPWLTWDRDHVPPNRVSDPDGIPVLPLCLEDLKTGTFCIDDDPPELTIPDDVIVECWEDAPGCNAAECTDDCGWCEVSCRELERSGSGCEDDPGRLVIRYCAIDRCGDETCDDQIVTVIDTIAPTFTSYPEDMGYECLEDVPPADCDLVDGIDNCIHDGPPVCSFDADRDNGGTGCADDPLIITRRYCLTDFCGNVTCRDQIITVVDEVGPTFTRFPSDMAYECEEDVPPADCDLVEGTDNCEQGGSPACSFDPDRDNGGTGCADDPLVITRRYCLTDFCGNVTCRDQIITVVDETAPTFTVFPEDENVQCLEDVKPPGLARVEAEDNCAQGGAPRVFHAGDTDNGGDGCTDSPLIITRTFCAVDFCGLQTCRDQIWTVIDDLEPLLVCPGNQMLECLEQVPPVDTGEVFVLDNCDHDGPPEIIHAGDFDNGGMGCMDDPLIIDRVYEATDDCGNTGHCQQIFIIADETPPWFEECPEDKRTPADAGCDGAIVLYDLPSAADNCDGPPEVVCDPPSGSVFPIGTTPVVCEVTDACGLVGDPCIFEVTVVDVNVIQVNLRVDYMEFRPDVPCETPRPFTFRLFEGCPSGPMEICYDDITIMPDGSATACIEVPCGDYTCVTAKDDSHSLRHTTEDVAVVPNAGLCEEYDDNRMVYVATWPNELLGGDLTNFQDECFIDILDVAAYFTKQNQECPPEDCGDLPHPIGVHHADINCDGACNRLGDFGFILANFQELCDRDCCAPPGPGAGQPRTWIEVTELCEMGLGHLAIADIDGDGIVSLDDVEAYYNGDRPLPVTSINGPCP